MLRAVRFFFKDSINRYFGLATVLIILAQVILLILKIQPSADGIFLHYTSYLGVDFVGAWYLVYLIPAGSVLCAILNTVAAWYISRKDMFPSYLLMIGSTLLAALLLTQAILIIRLNA